MKITDYENGRQLRDIGISLTSEEAKEMIGYLQRLIEDSSISHAYLTEVSARGIEREIAVTIDGPRDAVGPRKLPLPRTRSLSVAS